MTSPLTFAVLLAPVALLAAAVAARGGAPVGRVARGTMRAALLGVAVALAAGLGTVVGGGLVESPMLGAAGLGLAVRLDALSAVMLLMVAVLATVILRFSATYLEGDPRHADFLARLALTAAAVELLVVAGNLAQFVVAWVLTSLALQRLLAFYHERPRARVAARKKWVMARAADGFLLTGAVLLYLVAGTGELGAVFAAVSSPGQPGTALAVAGVCLVAAAALKSAQFPFHGWLIEVMETPTPVSALLHAGILNAGPFLVLRLSGVIDTVPTAVTALMVVGGCTALFASIALLTQPSVKVGLAYSSVAHMGFMLLVCGMGLYAAALLHLVAHSFYKAHAFLSSGSVVDEARAAKVALPARLGSPARMLASLAVAVVVYLPLGWLWGVELGGDPMVVAMGAILVLGTTQLVAPTLDARTTGDDLVRTAGLAVGVTLAFFGLEAGAHHLLAGAVPEAAPRSAGQVAVVGVIVAAMASVIALQVREPARPSGPWRRSLAVHLRNGLYVNAVLDRLLGSHRVLAPAEGRR